MEILGSDSSKEESKGNVTDGPRAGMSGLSASENTSHENSMHGEVPTRRHKAEKANGTKVPGQEFCGDVENCAGQSTVSPTIKQKPELGRVWASAEVLQKHRGIRSFRRAGSCPEGSQGALGFHPCVYERLWCCVKKALLGTEGKAGRGTPQRNRGPRRHCG